MLMALFHLFYTLAVNDITKGMLTHDTPLKRLRGTISMQKCANSTQCMLKINNCVVSMM